MAFVFFWAAWSIRSLVFRGGQNSLVVLRGTGPLDLRCVVPFIRVASRLLFLDFFDSDEWGYSLLNLRLLR